MAKAYLSRDAAAEWCEQRGQTAWLDLLEGEDEALLLRASEWIDQHVDFRGRPEDASQDRAWPRIDAYHDHGHAFLGIPKEVIEAVMSLALAMIDGDDHAETLLGLGRRINQQKAGGVEIRYEAQSSQHLTRVMRLLEPLTQPRQSRPLQRG